MRSGWMAVMMTMGCWGSGARESTDVRAPPPRAQPAAEPTGRTMFAKGQVEIQIEEVGAREPIDVTIRIRGLSRAVTAQLALTGAGVDELGFAQLVPRGFQGCDPVHSASECANREERAPYAHVRMQARLPPGSYQLRVWFDLPTWKFDETIPLRVGTGASPRFRPPPKQ